MIQQGTDFGFVGDAYEAPMLLQDAQRCINWYCEVSEDKTNGSKMPIALLGCPGLQSVFTPGAASVVRGQWTLPGGTSALAVIGNIVYLIATSLSATNTTAAVFAITQIGTLLTYTGPVSIRDNGVALGGAGGFAVIVDGMYGYYYLLSGVANTVTFTGGVTSGSKNITVSSIPAGLIVTPGATMTDTAGDIPGGTTFTGANFNSVQLTMSANATGTNASDSISVTIPVFGQITDTAFLPASMVAFIEGWLIFSEPGTRTFFTNAATPYTLLFAGSFYALKDSSTDNLVSLYENNRELWLLGERTSEVWYDAGNANFALARIPAIGPQMGCAATYSVTRMGPDLVWLGRNEQGQNIVVKQNNYQWERISTHAIDKAIASYSVVSDAIGFSYEEEGHWFYILTFPTADVTWCYDGKTQMWHQRGSFDTSTGTYHRFRANSFCNVSDTSLVGDFQNGKIYQMSRSFYTDDGAPLRCQRRAPHVWSKQNRKRLFHGWLQVEFTPGVGTAASASNNSPYTANAVYFNGTDYLLRGGALTGLTDGKTGSISFWIRVDGGDGTSRVILEIQNTGGGAEGIELSFSAPSNYMQIIGFNSAGTIVLNMSTSPYTISTKWLNVLASWDLSTGKTNLYVNNIEDNNTLTATNDTIDYTKTNSAIAATTGAVARFVGGMSEVWFNNSYIDFSVLSNRYKFIDSNGYTVNLGSDGSIPTGTSPIIYMNGNATSFGTNSGTGGNYSIIGTLSTTTGPSAVQAQIVLNGYNPQAMLRWYDYNKNKNWSSEHWNTIGKTGEVTNRCIWRRLGSSRDRIYELNFSDPVPRDIIGVTLFFEPEEETEAQLSRTA